MNQLVEICRPCGKPADDEHHALIGNPAMGKGMGGTALDDADHFHYIPLCRSCHDLVHMKKLRILSHDKPFIAELPNGETVRRDDRTDEELASTWVEGSARALSGAMIQAEVAMAFKDRYGAYGKGWYIRAADIIQQTTGVTVTGRTVYSRVHLGRMMRCAGDDAAQAVATLGIKTSEAIGKHADPQQALAEASALRDAGEKMTDIARTILNADPNPCEEHVCRKCGTRW